MNINLKPEYEQFIQSQIANGQFTTVDEVINEAVKLLENRANQLEELKRKIVLGTEQIKQGSVTDGEVVFERLQAKIRSIAQENE
ncbi:type II toxin-antitoxin system ParD family antitoxin [Brunnivagina elsteri]|uniref:Type II toxin-antitoxin system ParD family antitoxin n=1 Tax=Brunnivagina elsteri CCALA 953 TaxID=987040 RepID=A0A2A2TQE5_9CYAN|nr:type II toxin-antitoxin system ParD family antitoxin [Calothrix elsteri]PAX60637.1 type II toxin-antitoxin system ParD family antitoxin [Calothrix elsteri CCALA 953]